MEKINGIESSIATQKAKKNKKEPKEKGSFRALGASQIASSASVPVGMAAIAGMSQVNKKLTPEQIEQINKAADAMIDATGLRAKGVKIDNVKHAGLNLSGMPDALHDLVNTYSAVANGKNAAFLTEDARNALTGEILHSKNTIIANRDKMSTALFHEIGHAFNANKSKFWKAMQKMRGPAMFIAASVAIFAAFTKKAEAKEEAVEAKAKKTTTKKVAEAAKDFKPQDPVESYLASRQPVNIKPVENPERFYNSRNAVVNEPVDPNKEAIESFLKSRGQ